MRIVKKFLGLGVVVSINLLLQFLFQWYLIVYFGAGTQSDIFFGSMAMPQFILLVLSGSLTMVLIPMISKFEGASFLKESWNYFQGIGLLFATLALLLCITAGWWVQWILPGFKGENYNLAVDLTRIQLLSMFFSSLLGFLWVVHSAKEKFYLIETTSIIANVLAFGVFYFTLDLFGIYAAAWVTVLKILLQILLLMRVLGPYQKPYFRSESFKITWKKIRPLLAGNLYYKTDTLVDRNLTSSGSSGELTLLALAQQIYSIGASIISKVFINTLIPSLSVKARNKDFNQLHQSYKKRFWLVFLISVFCFLLIVSAGKPILSFVFGFKNFTADSIDTLWNLLIFLFGLWFAGLLGNLTTGTFYAKGDTVTPTRIGVILFTLYIPVKIYFFKKFGISALAISISIYMLLNLVLQMIYLERKKNFE